MFGVLSRTYLAAHAVQVLCLHAVLAYPQRLRRSAVVPAKGVNSSLAIWENITAFTLPMLSLFNFCAKFHCPVTCTMTIRSLDGERSLRLIIVVIIRFPKGCRRWRLWGSCAAFLLEHLMEDVSVPFQR